MIGHEKTLQSSLRRPAARMRRAAYLPVLLALLCGSLVETSRAGELSMRMGFTPSIFVNRNENDVIASMKVWVQTLARERNIDLDPDIIGYRSIKAARSAVTRAEVDMLILSLDEYSEMPEGVLSEPFLRDEVNGTIYSEFVLLAQKGSVVRGVKDLRGMRVMIHESVHGQLGLCWLDFELAMAGMNRLGQVADTTEKVTKLSAAVLTVFFGKSDACLVRSSGFKSMIELNPQIGNRLHVVEMSPPVIPSLICFRTAVASEDKQKLFREILRLHESITGQQVMRVFQSERMREISVEELQESLDLLQTWKATRSGAFDVLETGKRVSP